MADDTSLDAIAGGSSGTLGRGGMITKLQAARLAARSGCSTIIVGGRNANILHQVATGDEVGTLLSAGQKPLAARKQWLAGHLQVKGQLVLDAGAVKVLTEQGRSLLAVGVRQVVGTFTRGDLVSCVNADGLEIARGLVNYNANEAVRILGQSTESIAGILGYREDDELIHRDNLVITG
jgi:glutamate 5-kinase